MPRRELEKWFRDARAQLAHLREDDTWRRPIRSTPDYGAQCLAQQWAAILDAAGNEAAARRADLQVMKQRQVRTADLARHGAKLRAAAKGVKLPLSRGPSWPATRAAAGRQLDSAGKKALTESATASVTTIQKRLDEAVAELTHELGAVAARWPGRAAAGDAGARGGALQPAGRDRAPAAGDAADICKRVEKQLDAGERAVWTAGKARPAVNRASQLSDAARAALDEVLPTQPRSLALVGLIRSPPPNDAWRPGSGRS